MKKVSQNTHKGRNTTKKVSENGQLDEKNVLDATLLQNLSQSSVTTQLVYAVGFADALERFRWEISPVSFQRVAELLRLWSMLSRGERVCATRFLALFRYQDGVIRAPLDRLVRLEAIPGKVGRFVVLTSEGFLAMGRLFELVRECVGDVAGNCSVAWGSRADFARRRARVPYYRDLSEAEQVQVLRDYIADPAPVEDKQREIFAMYGLTNWELRRAFQRFKAVLPPRVR